MADQKFLDDSRRVAACFLHYYLDDCAPETRSPNGPTKQDLEDRLAANEGEPAMEAGRRLRELGDRIDDLIKEELEKALQELCKQRSVWEIAYPQFNGACSQLLSRCQGAFRSGWDQVCVIYSMVGRLVRELRLNQSEVDPSSPSLRERNMQDFAGQFILNHPDIQEWIEHNGGLVSDITSHSLKWLCLYR